MLTLARTIVQMKTRSINVLLAASVFLLSVQSALAATCGAGTLAAGGTCTCPTGLGIIASSTLGGTAGSTAWTSSTSGTVTTITVSAASSLTAAQAVNPCTDLFRGYAFPAATAATAASQATACTTANSYCPGATGAVYWGSSATVLATTTVTTPAVGTAGTPASAAGSNLVMQPCPTNSVSNAAFTSCTNSAGYYQASAATTGIIALPTACSQNFYCLGGGDASTIIDRTACPTNSGNAGASANNNALSTCLLTAGNYVSSYTAASGNTPASATASTCPANSYCVGSAAISAANVVACPSINLLGDASYNTAGTGNTAITSCLLSPGYYQTGYASPSATVAVCPSNYYCLGAIAIVTTASTTLTNGATACPYLVTLGDASTTPSGSSSSVLSDCYINPGYSLVTPTFTGSISTTTLTVTAVTTGFITAGSAIAGATSAATITAQLTGTVGGVGTYTVSVSQSFLSGTITIPQPVGQLCLVNTYCPGGYVTSFTLPVTASAIGTVGDNGAVGCPTGTTLAAAVASSAATANNGVTDCVVPAGSYVTTIQGSPSCASACSSATSLSSASSSCPAGATCSGGFWSDTVGSGITTVMPGFVVISVSGIVPTISACPSGAACAGSSGSNLLTIGYGAQISNTDYYVSAPGATSACPAVAAPCTQSHSLTTAGGATIPSGYYIANSAVNACPTGATCAGSPFANITNVAYGAVTNAGYYVSTKATSGQVAVAVVTACPSTTRSTCAGGQSLATQGGIVINAGSYASSVVASGANTGVVTVAACPTGAVCAGATGANAFTPGYGATTLAGYWLSVGAYIGVSALTLTSGGSGYTTGALRFTNPSGATTATGTFTAGGGVIATVTLTGAGSAYTAAPTVDGDALGGANAVITATITSFAGTVSVCGSGSGSNADDKRASGYALTAATGGRAVAGGTSTVNVVDTFYQGNGSTAATAVYAVCPTGVYCTGTGTSKAGILYSGAQAAAGYYVSAVGVVSACPSGAACAVTNAICSAVATPNVW